MLTEKFLLKRLSEAKVTLGANELARAIKDAMYAKRIGGKPGLRNFVRELIERSK